MVNPPPPPESYPLQHKTPKGTLIEASSDEEGFRGALYLGTVLGCLPKSTSKKRKKALIQYKTLLADDGSSPLTEYVDPAFIRPLPPKDKEDLQSCFEVKEIVDARYKDGWWTGVVRKVLGKSKYRVYFDNPPDVIEFDRKDLRVHWDWIDGEWVRPEKQQSTGSIFSSGISVEVNTDKENLRNVWFPAIVIKENGDNTFLVKHQSSKNDGESGTVKVVVDYFHIRPSPPRYADRNYELLERVDTTYNFGWRTGVVTKILPGRRYKVFFKHGNEDKELSHSDLRPNVEWIDGKWTSRSKLNVIASDEQELAAGELESSLSGKDSTEDKTPSTKQPTPTDENNALLSSKKNLKPETSNSNTSHCRPSKKLAGGNKEETSLLVACDRLKDMPHEASCEEGTPRNGVTGTRFMKKTAGDQPCAKTESSLTGATPQTASNGSLFCQHRRSNWMAKKRKVDSVDNLVKRSLRPRKSPGKGPQVPTAAKEGILRTAEEINEGEVETTEVDMPIILGLAAKSTKTLQDENSFQIRDLLNNVNDSVRNENMETKEHKVGVSNQNKRGRPRKSVVTSPKAFVAGKEQNGVGDLADKKVVKDCMSNGANLSKHKGVELAASQDACRGRSSDDPTPKEVHSPSAGTSDMVNDDQPLSTWIGAVHTSGVGDPSLSSVKPVNERNGERLVEVPVESLAMDSRSGSPSDDDDRILPFVKKSRLWGTIESMDVFQIVPQKPHFQPLAENREEFREGSAIGIMVTFASLFEKISILSFDDPRNTFDSILESLNDLEKHGFDVTLLRGRLNKLLSIKEGQEQHLGERKNAEREMIENTKEVTKLDEGMKEIERKITELQEQHSVLKSEKETKILKLGNLKLHVDVLNGLIQNGLCDFKKLASSPWKSP